MSQEEFQTLLQFFKALADENRLKMIGILAEQEYSVEELAAMLHLKAPTISHHLTKLKELELVEMRPEGNTHVYRLNAEALRNSSKQLLIPEKMASLVDDVEGDAWERKVLRDFFDGTQLKEIPASRKKRLVILKWFAHQFAEGVLYKESQVNEIIQRHHIDAAFWRRELVGANLMQRENGFYWRVPFKDLPTDAEKRSVILRGLANQFEYRTLYQESEADELIARCYPNALLLRQELLDAGLIQSESGLYWRAL
jgi:predicted transcriptional regulator